MLEEFHRAVDAAGARGLSKQEMCARFGYSRLDTRLICRNLARRGCVGVAWMDAGRQRYERSAVFAHIEIFILRAA